MYVRRTRILFSRARMQSSNSAGMTINLALLLGKLCKVHMRVFEIVAHRSVDN